MDRIGRFLALNPVEYPIAAEIPIGEGLLIFLPVAPKSDPKRLSAALVETG